MKSPIGIQSFEQIIEDSFVYVDKKAMIYDLVKNGKFYFLSRPRRFGRAFLSRRWSAFICMIFLRFYALICTNICACCTFLCMNRFGKDRCFSSKLQILSFFSP